MFAASATSSEANTVLPAGVDLPREPELSVDDAALGIDLSDDDLQVTLSLYYNILTFFSNIK